MKTLILYAVITVWTFKAYSVNGTLSISDSGINTVGSTTYVLACNIAPYNSQASWERDGTVIVQCPVVGCSASTDTRYSFSNDAGAIYVHFLQLQANENGINWKCKHAFDQPANFTVEVDSSTPSSSNDLTGGEIAGIVIGVLFFLCTVAIIIYLIILNLKGKPAPITNSVPTIHKPKPNTGKPAPITNSGQPAPITNSVPVIPKPKPDTDKLPSITRHDPVEQSMLGHDKPSSIKHHDKLPSIKRNGDPEPRQVHESA